MLSMGAFLCALSLILAMVIFNKLVIRPKTKKVIKETIEWSNENCHCGLARAEWKVYGVDTFTKTVLLGCSGCGRLWEEQMTPKGNHWRMVDKEYAKYNYPGYKGEII